MNYAALIWQGASRSQAGLGEALVLGYHEGDHRVYADHGEALRLPFFVGVVGEAHMLTEQPDAETEV